MAPDPSGAVTRSRWPTGTEYAESVQQPTTSFRHAELTGGRLTLTPLGLPAMASGQSAVAFHFETPRRAVAVRCLLSAHDDGRERYTALGAFVAREPVPDVVAAEWLDEGIRVDGQWWPIVIMPWVSGQPLHDAVLDRVGDPARLVRLADRWFDLVKDLQDRRFAHGDLQHGNILLTDDDEYQLVDLDGIWVPDIGVGPPNEYGHPNYQHRNRGPSDWGQLVDTFSALVIGLSIVALADDPSLERFMTGENLLFAKDDFVSPGASEIWKVLDRSNSAQVVDHVRRLRTLASDGAPRPMSLADVLDDPELALATPTPPPVDNVLPGAADAGDWWTEPGAATSTPPVTAVPSGAAADAVAGTERPAASAAASQPTAHHATAPSAAGLAAITGRPMIAGLVSGLVAGLLGSLIAGALQLVTPTDLDGGVFVAVIAALLGGFVNAWPAINLRAYQSAIGRFFAGAAVGAVAGAVAIVLSDAMIKATIGPGDTEHLALVAYTWALTAGLIGVAVGALRSWRAAAYAFSFGAVGGCLGGLIHGATTAEFSGRRLAIDATDGATLLMATLVAMLIGTTIALALRTSRTGSLTVVEGKGQGTVIDFHKSTATIGSSTRDTLVLAGSAVPARAVHIRLTDASINAQADVPVQLDGTAVANSFTIRSGQILAVGGVFVRIESKELEGISS